MSLSIDPGKPGWQERHVALYLATDGAQGHIEDFTKTSGAAQTPCLVLKHTGRRSGQTRLTPLAYGKDGDDFVVVASKGGAPDHPAWFLNLEATPDICFQVKDKKYRGRAEVTDGAARERLFAKMCEELPFYAGYQTKTDRKIPVVLLKPLEEIESL